MAGSISLSLSQQFDELGKPLSGGRLYFIQAGTTSTPQNAFFDTALTLPLPNPVTLDAAGRVPAFYLADGQIKVRLTNSAGVTQIEQDNLLVIGPSSGGGGGGGVDPTTIFQTGDVMWLDTDGARTGWVRDNGRSIGSAGSGATERANADTQALYTFLWNTFSNTICPVAGGRGASASADFSANKAIGLPNKQGLIVGGTDGMGATASSAWSSTPVVSGSVTTAGSVIGAITTTLVTGNLPPYTPSGTVAGTITTDNINSNAGTSFSGAGRVFTNATGSFASSLPLGGTFTGSLTGSPQGGSSTPFYNPQKTVLGTFYRKL